MSCTTRSRCIHDQIVEAQKPKKNGQAPVRPSTASGSRVPGIDWAHIRDLAVRTKGPELVITSAVGDDISVDEMPELEDVVRQARGPLCRRALESLYPVSAEVPSRGMGLADGEHQGYRQSVPRPVVQVH